MIVQLYQATVQNPEAFLIDFKNYSQSDIFFRLSEFLSSHGVDAIELCVNWHDKSVKITYIKDERRESIEAGSDCYVLSLIPGTLTFCKKSHLRQEFGLVDNVRLSNQDID